MISCQVVNEGERGAILLLSATPGKTTPGHVAAHAETSRRASADDGSPRGTVHAKFRFVHQLRTEDLIQGKDDVFRNDVSQGAGARAVRRLVQVSIVYVPADIPGSAVVELMVNAGHTVIFTGNVSSIRLCLVSPCRIIRVGLHTFWICVDEGRESR